MNENQPVNFKNEKLPRNEMLLPPMHYIEIDDWQHVIGSDTLMLWRTFLTLVNRKEATESGNFKIPQGMRALAKRLGISYPTLQKKIKILWNYGFIDLEEYDDGRKGPKPLNIIPYSYPCKDHRRSILPLEKVRDYDTDYHSKARHFGTEGNKIRHENKKTEIPENETEIPENETKIPENETEIPENTPENIADENEKNANNPLLAQVEEVYPESYTHGKNNFTTPGKNNFTTLVKNILPINKDLKVINKDLKVINDDDDIKPKIPFSADQIESIILEIREEYPHIHKRTFDTITKKCVQLLKDGKIMQTFPNYLRQALANKEEQLQRRREAEISAKRKKAEAAQRKAKTNENVMENNVPFYNWLEE